MRPAAAGWEEEYATKFESIGYTRGVAAPTVFMNEETGVRLVVHGDDFSFCGSRRELEKVRTQMAEWWDIKDRGIMGSEEDEIKEVVILGRRLRTAWRCGPMTNTGESS